MVPTAVNVAEMWEGVAQAAGKEVTAAVVGMDTEAAAEAAERAAVVWGVVVA